MMKNILITGGSGLVGAVLTPLLESKGYQVAWLSRSPEKQTQKSFNWDVKAKKIDPKALDWADAIVHLAGTGVAEKRWTQDRKNSILNSRTQSAELLFNELRSREKKPEAVISASGVNYYGLDNGDQLLTESDPPGDDFLSEVVVKWERAVRKFEDLGIRTASLRTGIVLSTKGGALPQLLQPPIAAPLGNGKQYMSWIHIEDLARMFAFALEEKNISGPYNAVAPQPITNSTLTKKAAHFKKKPFLPLPVPGFLLRIVLGEMAGMILGGNKASCDKIISAGFKFQFNAVDQVLKDLFKR